MLLLMVCWSVCFSTVFAFNVCWNLCDSFLLTTYLQLLTMQYFFLSSDRQHPSYGDCLEVKREYYQNRSVLDCVTQCSQSTTHLYEQFLRSNGFRLSHFDPYAVRRGGCLELYYCNMVEWFWWDSSLISTTNWFPSVLWHCWFGHLAGKNRPWNDLLCVEWDVKPYRLTHAIFYLCYYSGNCNIRFASISL